MDNRKDIMKPLNQKSSDEGQTMSSFQHTSFAEGGMSQSLRDVRKTTPTEKLPPRPRSELRR